MTTSCELRTCCCPRGRQDPFLEPSILYVRRAAFQSTTTTATALVLPAQHDDDDDELLHMWKWFQRTAWERIGTGSQSCSVVVLLLGLVRSTSTRCRRSRNAEEEGKVVKRKDLTEIS